MKTDPQKLPQYIKINDTAMARTGDKKIAYWREAGYWGLSVKEDENGNLVGNNIYDQHNQKMSFKHLKGAPIIECTREEWAEDNQGYI
jgi:hypothetical protein